MENILGIMGSPRRQGNCKLMVKAVSRQIERPHRLRLLRLVFAEIRGQALVYAALPGAVCLDNANLETAARLARALGQTTPRSSIPRRAAIGPEALPSSHAQTAKAPARNHSSRKGKI